MLPEGHVARRLRIIGRVQGVWYRGWAMNAAKALDLDGWVRNRMDGSVEALVVGPEAAVEEFIRRCHRGPSAANVERVDIEPAQGIVAEGFVQKPTV